MILLLSMLKRLIRNKKLHFTNAVAVLLDNFLLRTFASCYHINSDLTIICFSGQFMTDSMLVVMYKQNIYSIERSKVYIRTFQVISFY